MSGPERSERAVHPARVLELDQPFTERDLYALRAAVTAHVTADGAPDHVVDALLIIVGELASNVVQHGGGSGRLSLWRDAVDIVCRVDDRGPGMADPERAGHRPVPPGAPAGRGLWIVRQLSRDVSIVSGPGGTTVTATVVRSPAP